MKVDPTAPISSGSGVTAIDRRAVEARRGRRTAAAAAVCLVASAAIGVGVRSGPTGPDTWLHDVAVAHRGSTDLAVALHLTEGGATSLVWPLIVAAALVFPRRAAQDGPSAPPAPQHGRRWLTSLAVAAGAGLGISARLGLSDVLRRARPAATDWATYAGGFAYPSGHTTAATLGAGLLAWALSRHLADRRARGAVWAVAVLYALTVGWTRVWLGVHWPADVVGGWLLGAGWLAGLAAVAHRLERRPAVTTAATTGAR